MPGRLRRLVRRLIPEFAAPGPKVLGVGWAKTGTTTLGECLRTLGLRHAGQRLDLVEPWARGDLAPLLRVARTHQAFEDWPWLRLYREFDRAFPGTRFILTTRDPAGWLRSYRNQIAKPDDDTPELHRIRRQLYGLPFPDVSDAQLVERFERHNADVRAYFADRPGDLLVVDWTRGDGWPELCRFLGRPIPATPFPHANRGEYRGAPAS